MEAFFFQVDFVNKLTNVSSIFLHQKTICVNIKGELSYFKNSETPSD